jgi:hypothetical protein
MAHATKVYAVKDEVASLPAGSGAPVFGPEFKVKIDEWPR